VDIAARKNADNLAVDEQLEMLGAVLDVPVEAFRLGDELLQETAARIAHLPFPKY
jgi:hypothetical protein